ncbi:hypothetical protein ACWCOP_13625 [Maricaulaceae bacterium MS644]
MTAMTSANKAARSAGAVWGWALRETGASLPGAFAHLGATGRAKLVPLDRQGEPGPAQGARRSLFAHWRHGGAPGGRLVVLLSPEAVLRRTLTLPAEAAGDLEQAVRLRFAAICPIPPEDASFAVTSRGWSPDGALTAEIAIARRSDLEKAVAAASSRAGDWTVAADFDGQGPALVFAEGAPKGRPSRWLMAALALAGLAAAWTVADASLSAGISGFEAARADLLTQSRALQESAPDAEAAARLAAYPSLAAVLSGVASAEARLPEGAAVEQVRVNQRSGLIILSDGEALALDIAELQP